MRIEVNVLTGEVTEHDDYVPEVPVETPPVETPPAEGTPL
jgi:hypothetical protein